MGKFGNPSAFMFPGFPMTQCCWFVIIAMMLLASKTSGVTIRLSMTGGVAWTGSCAQTNCTSSTPCLLTSEVFVNEDPVNCLLVLSDSTDFGSFTFHNLANTTTALTSDLTVFQEGSVNLLISSNVTICGIYVEVPMNVSVVDWMVGEGISVEVGGSCGWGTQFYGSPFTFNGGIKTANFKGTSLSVTGSPFIFKGTEAPHLILDDMQITMYTISDFIGGTAFNGMTIMGGTRLTLRSWLTQAPAANVPLGALIRITGADTQLLLSSSTQWVKNAARYRLEVTSGATLRGFSTNQLLSLGLFQDGFLASDAVFQLLKFDIASNNTGHTLISNTTFIDCQTTLWGENNGISMEIHDSAFLSNGSNLATPGLYLRGSSNHEFGLYNVTVDANGMTATNGGALWLIPASVSMNNTTGTTSNSSVITSKLFIADGTEASMANLNVTEMISRFNISQTPAPVYLRPTSNDSVYGISPTWQFDSINIVAVAVNLSGLNEFVYRAIPSPLVGIKFPLPLFDGSDSFVSPDAVIIDWVPQINTEQPILGQYYPVGYFSSWVQLYFRGFQAHAFSWSYTSMTRFVQFRVRSSSPTAPVSPCPSPIPSGFTCIDGKLVSSGDVESPTITIPPNSGTVQVNGNLTSETVVFDGIGSTLNISGCANIPGGIVIELKGNDSKEKNIPDGPIVLVTQDDSCDGSLLDVPVQVNEEKSCEKTKVTTDPSATKSSLAVLMSVDSSACHTRWIILGSVLGGVLVATATVAITWRICVYKKRVNTRVPSRPS